MHPIRPIRRQRVPPLFRRPEILRQHGHAGRNGDHVRHAFHCLGARTVEGFEPGAEPGRVRDHRRQHVRQPHVLGEHRAAVGLVSAVLARHVFADVDKVLRIFQPDFLRRRDGLQCRSGRELSEAGLAAGRRVGYDAAARPRSSPPGPATRTRPPRRAWPGPRRPPCAFARRNWRLPCCRRYPAPGPRADCCSVWASAGAPSHADLRPVGVEFLRHQGSQAGVGPCPISMFLPTTVTVSSSPMRTKALGSNAGTDTVAVPAMPGPDPVPRPAVRQIDGQGQADACLKKGAGFRSRFRSRSCSSPYASDSAASLMAARMRRRWHSGTGCRPWPVDVRDR